MGMMKTSFAGYIPLRRVDAQVFSFLVRQGKETLSQQLFFLSPLVLPPRELGIAEIAPGSSYNVPALRLTKWTEMKEQNLALKWNFTFIIFGLLKASSNVFLGYCQWGNVM